ncbi:BatA domain-containing protein [candidate division KSB1 bacterium]
MSFINPLFLIALGGAVLPVIIHLIRKMRAKKVKFSSLLFLKATPKELIKKRRLRDLILLMVRTMIFALLAFAFARPFIPRERIPFVPQESIRSVVLLIDNSYSMQYGNLFEQVRMRAEEALDDAGDADEFAVVIFNDETEQLTSLSTDIDVHKNVLENRLEPSYRPTDFYKPVRLAEEILKDAKNPDKEIILISDFQAAGWSLQFENWNIDPEIHVEPVKIAPENPENSYMFNFNLKKSRVGTENVAEYKIEMRTPESKPESEIELWINNREIDAQTVRSEQMNQAFFQQREVREGDYMGYVRTGDDDLMADNAYYFNYDFQALPTLFCIDGGQTAELSDAFYLQNAFDLGEVSIFGFTSGSLNQLSRARIIDYNALFIMNNESLSDNHVETLKWYLSQGGSMVLSFGDRVDLQRYSAVLSDLGVGRIEEIVDAREYQPAVIGEVDFKHPVFSVFAEVGTGELIRPNFRQYVRIIPDSASTVIGRYDTNDPFLIERKVDQGKILVFTSSFINSWSDFPVHEIFLPFVYQLAGYANSRDNERSAFLVGQLVSLFGNPGDVWEVSAPGDKLFKVELDEFGRGFFRETAEPGNYSAANESKEFNFSVNVDVRESDLRTKDTEEAVAAISQPSGVTESERLALLAGELEEQEGRQKLWRYIVLLIVALFAFESWFANKKMQTLSKTEEL